MNEQEPDQHEHENEAQSQRIPALQKLFDRPFILLLLGMLVMVVFYTAWGLFEILTLPESALP